MTRLALFGRYLCLRCALGPWPRWARFAVRPVFEVGAAELER
jgi:hypothetical protein